MTLLKRINYFKTKIFKFLTASFKNSKNLSQLSRLKKNNIKRILITRPNHRLGNQLLISPLIQVLSSEFPNSKIDLLVNGGLSKIIFKNYKNIDTTYNLPKKPFKNLINYIKVSTSILRKKYDISIVGTEDSNSSKIFVKLSRAKYKIYEGIKNEEETVHIAKEPIDNILHFLYKAEPKKTISYPPLDIKLSPEEISIGEKITNSYFNNELLTLAVFTNATGNKKLSKQWWNDFINQLKLDLPRINILEVLPKENISQLDFQTTSYYSNDLREIASVIENCTAFIGSDSGIMHLATSTKTSVFGLFNGATNPLIYGPYGKDKYTININELSIQEITEKIKTVFQNKGYK